MDWARPEIIWVFIPITAIVGGIVRSIVTTVLTAQDRRMELQIRLKQAGVPQVDDAATGTLRAEFEKFKETSTQYDLSLDHTLREIESRLSSIERRMPAPRPATVAPAPAPAPASATDDDRPQQVVGRTE